MLGQQVADECRDIVDGDTTVLVAVGVHQVHPVIYFLLFLIICLRELFTVKMISPSGRLNSGMSNALPVFILFGELNEQRMQVLLISREFLNL